MASWYAIRARGAGAEVAIYDEIGAYGVSAKDILAELGALPEAAPIDLRLNSPGGSVFDAVAIYNALKRHQGTVTVTIDGIAASAASYVAMAGDEVVMPENAFLMIHDPSGMVLGTAADMRATAEALDKIAGSLVRGYAAKSGRSDEEIVALMTKETWLDAAEAVEFGFADRMSEPVRLAASFDIRRFRNAPPDLVEAVESSDAADDADDGQTDDAAEEVDDDDAQGHASQSAADPPGCSGGPEPAQPAAPEPSPDLATVRNEALAYARAVVDLCRLAGQPQMAAGFLADGADLEQIRKTLIDARAKAEPDISASHPQPGPGREAWPWGDVIARTFKRKG
ncbi:head maturation protease, ClpP-related [Roseitranquillus sediminis]|uniref:head maturation protease, ClpP-related n=1 Tax=Roseitranquillus sediminis TaxID=2809051 RepID=UPI001D0CB414|nr:head maturation protease, ClpP-related [Roseitranquillus sediminis]MBM9592941.1 Clp protease ClpP [Roseitranquillus sediminis]